MKNSLIFVLTLALLAGISLAQTSAQSQAGGSAQQQGSTELQTNPTPSQNATGEASASNQIAPGTQIPAELSKSVDAKKAKAGDQVVAKTTQDMLVNGRVVIPRNSKIIGHITEAKPREKGESGSTLGIAFDKIVMKGGRELPLNASIQAMAAAQNNAALSNEPIGQPTGATGGAAAGRPGGGVMGGEGRTVGNVAGTATGAAGNIGSTAGNTAGGATGSAGNARLNTNSQGVIGLSGLSLNVASDANQGTVITSQNKNVKLDSGTELMLRVNSK